MIRVYDAAWQRDPDARARGTIRRFMNVIREIRILVAFNGELGNSRDASVDADGTKSRLPK